jgi:4-amino-4-deoxychorismate lyase
MYQLVESVRIENRQLHLIEFHNQRLNSAMHRLFGATEKIRLEEIITIPPDLTDDRYKCRVTFSPETINVNILPYVQREIKTLKVVHDDRVLFQIGKPSATGCSL